MRGAGDTAVSTRRLPPLTALRAFEAAARRLSIGRAGEELNVTPAAISHQVKALEEWLGVRLFLRLKGALHLTPAGLTYLGGLSEGFDMLWDVTEQVAVRDERSTLNIVVPPSIASNWLVPRLHRYHALRPEMEIRVTVSNPPIDFSQHMMDIGVAFGWEVPPGLVRFPWLSYEIVAACSPHLLEGPDAIRVPQDLSRCRLLHDDALRIHDRMDWRLWLECCGIERVDQSKGIHFSHATHVYQMAADGHGVVLAKNALIADAVQRGRLVTLFDLAVPSDLRYELVCFEALTENPKLTHFREWLVEEARRDGFLWSPNRVVRPARGRGHRRQVGRQDG